MLVMRDAAQVIVGLLCKAARRCRRPEIGEVATEKERPNEVNAKFLEGFWPALSTSAMFIRRTKEAEANRVKQTGKEIEKWNNRPAVEKVAAA
jgi:hypothetical protein